MVDKEGFWIDFLKIEEKVILNVFVFGFGIGCVFFEKLIC